jgi:lipid-A-disaccharide synthase
MHYFIIAGEASGDLHGAALIDALKDTDSEAQFSFLGGDMMTAAANTEPIIHYRRMAYMGFSEVLRHLSDISANMKQTRQAIADRRPDCIVLIDYPSFNLKVAAYAAKLGIPVYYYISPKIWAWKQWRVRTIKKLVRRVYCILPFEPEFYAKHGYRADYVGNPSVEEIAAARANAPSRDDFINANKLRNKRIIALLPGSRKSEIRNNLPIMVEAARRFPQYQAIVAGAPGIDDEHYAAYTSLPVLRNSTYALLAHSHAALVTSGTATLETALMNVPQVVTYRANGSKLSYKIMKRLLSVKFVSLPNIIADKTVIPEMLLHECTPELVGERLAELMPDHSPQRAAMLDGYELMRQRLGTNRAAQTTATLLYNNLINND